MLAVEPGVSAGAADLEVASAEATVGGMVAVASEEAMEVAEDTGAASAAVEDTAAAIAVVTVVVGASVVATEGVAEELLLHLPHRTRSRTMLPQAASQARPSTYATCHGARATKTLLSSLRPSAKSSAPRSSTSRMAVLVAQVSSNSPIRKTRQLPLPNSRATPTAVVHWASRMLSTSTKVATGWRVRSRLEACRTR